MTDGFEPMTKINKIHLKFEAILSFSSIEHAKCWKMINIRM